MAPFDVLPDKALDAGVGMPLLAEALERYLAEPQHK